MLHHTRATITSSRHEDTIWLRLEKSIAEFPHDIPADVHRLTEAQTDFFFTAQEHAATVPDRTYPRKVMLKPFSPKHWKDWEELVKALAER